MEQLAGFDFAALHFAGDGKLRSAATLAELQNHVSNAGVTDVILLSHGFINDEHDARSLYQRFLESFRKHRDGAELKDRLANRTIAVAGVFWPSKAFPDGKDKPNDEGGTQSFGDEADELAATRAQLIEIRDKDVTEAQRPIVEEALALLDSLEDNEANQDKFVKLMLSLVDESERDEDEGFEQLAAKSGAEIFESLSSPIILPTVQSDDEGGVASVGAMIGGGSDGTALSIGGFFKTVAGKAGALLNTTTWYMMKNRSGTVGDRGVADTVRALRARHPSLKVHLVGHSLGGRLMTSCAKSLSAAPKVQPDSLTLLEAAFSHYGLAADNGRGKPGFFRDVLVQQVVKGPFISTHSYQDTVVGTAYALASRLAGDNTKKIGDKDDQYGGIGRNGTQKTAEATNQVLRTPGNPYSFPLDMINNLDGSGGLIKDHSDVTNATVTYAFANAMAQT